MIAFYGEQAEKLNGRLPLDLHAIVADETGLTAAYRDAVRRRERGEAFYLLFFANDRRVGLCNIAAKALNEQYVNADERAVLARELPRGTLGINGKMIGELWAHPEAELLGTAARELSNLADELLVRSHAEYARMLALGCHPKAYRRILPAPSAPPLAQQRAGTPSIIVWGPHAPSDQALALIGLEQYRGDVSYISTAALPNVRARFIPLHSTEAAVALASAGCIVCTDPGDPSDAVAFSTAGRSVVAPITSGAHEYSHSIVSWDAANAFAIMHCVSVAQGRAADESPPDDLPLVPHRAGVRRDHADLPLVTIITATYNRRGYLRSMLECIAAQTYPNIESIVVNDAGEMVDDIVAEFPFARCINAPSNGGTLVACKLGLDAARGAYIGLLPDDDWLYPDHVERLMDALLQSGAAWAHSFSLLRFLRYGPAGSSETYGFNGSCFAATTTAFQAQVGTPVAGHQCLQRKDTFDPSDVGWYLMDAVAADQEYHMRLFERYTPVVVDQHTCEFRDHPRNQGRALDYAEAMREIYEDIRPVNDRPYVATMREQALASQRTVALGDNVNRPTVTF